ncbi:hypothetical protein FOZ60_012187 [Perkinsus olseni]|uniref:Uncharacterized protein n=1 Tax=Perkinsus olseni TaxID=32597 RepID=A0A7J6QUF6_PEROL|nr:hypothetical protein FOZ60_012187 [Perkinsus olseni]KAF4711933.1 hypothetical protein FOZ62_026534 [Perkinsus olseni]
MLRFVTFFAAVAVSSFAQDGAIPSAVLEASRNSKEVKDEAAESTGLGRVLSGPSYERPTGKCQPGYGGVWGCACEGDEEAFGVLNQQGYVQAVVCTPYCDDTRVRRTLRQGALVGSDDESCPAPKHGKAECISGLCFIAAGKGCPPGMRGTSVKGLGDVCMYFY